MRAVLIVILSILFKISSAVNYAYYHCANIGSQREVSLDQLMGKWYGIEIISHRKDNILYMENVSGVCLQIIIEEDYTASTTTSTTYYRDYTRNDYGNNYDNNNRQTGYEYYETSTTSSYEARRYQNKNYRNRNQYRKDKTYGAVEFEQKKLDILWIATDGHIIKYSTSYMSTPGEWHITGPRNATSVIEAIEAFDGTIQVLKAVGDHMVLTFCHRRPDPQLYTVILSRTESLRKNYVQAIHHMLNKKGLEMVNVQAVCNSSVIFRVNSVLLILYAVYNFLI